LGRQLGVGDFQKALVGLRATSTVVSPNLNFGPVYFFFFLAQIENSVAKRTNFGSV
jgi:hypothetical protein